MKLENTLTNDLSIEEIVELAAVDSEFFTATFFPRTARQGTPPFHSRIWKRLDSNNRMVSILVFRGGAKTSLLRIYTAKRIAYALSRTILYIGKSESHAIRSVNWLKNQVETNVPFSHTYGLKPGSKWQDTESEIEHNVAECNIWMMATGITGSVRGINRDDFRPDLIVLDDVIDDENAGTQEQREKVKTRIYGAVKESLAPRSESPDAKMVMLQTPIHRDDASVQTLSDPEWASERFGIFTPETENLPPSQQVSSWEERYPTEEVRKDKAAAIARNQASVWYREKECRLVNPETTAFRPKWLKYYEKPQIPAFGARVLVVDPVPPPSPKEIEEGLVNKDFECIHVVQRTLNDYYSVDYEINRGHDPSWTIATLFTLAEKYNVRKILVESVAYQRTLAWLIRRAMEQRRRFWQVHEFTDQRNKYSKIVDSLNGIAAEGHLYVKKDMTDLISQFEDYPSISHDDVLETLALGVAELSGLEYDEQMFGDAALDDDQEEIDFSLALGAP